VHSGVETGTVSTVRARMVRAQRTLVKQAVQGGVPNFRRVLRGQLLGAFGMLLKLRSQYMTP
jgi:hypothetical protein